MKHIMFSDLGYISGDGRTFTYICSLKDVRQRRTQAHIAANIDTVTRTVSFEAKYKKRFSKEDVEDAITAVISFLRSADKEM